MGVFFIILGIILVVIALGMIYITTSYIIHHWENNKIEKLTTKIMKVEKDVLQQNNSFKSNYNKSLSSQAKSKPLQLASDIYLKARKKIQYQQYPKWIQVGMEYFNSFKIDSTKAFKSLFEYLISLTKPSVNDENSFKDQKSFNQKTVTQKNLNSENFNHSQNIKSAINTNTQESKNRFNSPQINELDSKTSTEKYKENRETAPSVPKEVIDEATISMIKTSEKDEKDMGLYEKMENRILTKLQQSGMNDWDLWLALGDLYVKYGENKKAMEIYALVMKHTGDEKQKETAMNKLIGL